jgi:hypothetical protein
MAVRLVDDDTEEFRGVTFAEYVLERYDIITGTIEEWSEDWAEVLYARSALELVRAELPPDRAKLLDATDAFWRGHPRAFNEFSKYHHARAKRDTALIGWVQDEAGNTPPIPLSHW